MWATTATIAAREELPEGFRDEDIEALRRTQERYRTSREEGDYAAREDTERRDPALAIVGGLLRVVRGKVSESDAATDIEAAERFLAGEETGRPKVER
jgi:hypothetical protein